MNILIRPAQPDDLDALADLWIELGDFHTPLHPRFALAEHARKGWKEFVSLRMVEGDWQIFLAEVDGIVVGFISGTVQFNPDIFQQTQFGHIMDIIVTAAHRRSGIGEQLVRAMFAWFQARGISVVDLNVAAANPAGQAFWRKLGFEDWLNRLTIQIP
jgi:ribosomal protein S18 acetylase RimI-like enzyme